MSSVTAQSRRHADYGAQRVLLIVVSEETSNVLLSTDMKRIGFPYKRCHPFRYQLWPTRVCRYWMHRTICRERSAGYFGGTSTCLSHPILMPHPHVRDVSPKRVYNKTALRMLAFRYIASDFVIRYHLGRYVHHRIHSSARPLKIFYHVGQKETILGWVTFGFELYVNIQTSHLCHLLSAFNDVMQSHIFAMLVSLVCC